MHDIQLVDSRAWPSRELDVAVCTYHDSDEDEDEARDDPNEDADEDANEDVDEG
jgi:hypothetical protein